MVVIGLVAGLSRLTGPEEYLILTTEGQNDWIRGYVSGPCRLIELPAPDSSTKATTRFLRLAKDLPRLGRVRRVWRKARTRPLAPIPTSDGTAERLGVSVIHFPYQRAFRTEIPSIYHPHDLQHVHLPQFFGDREREDRDRLFRAFSEQAQVVAVASDWVKRDVEAHLGLPAAKVKVVPLAAPIAEYEELTKEERIGVVKGMGIPGSFLLYPAQTWPHKNHAGLLRAMALLRERGIHVHVVFTGRQTAFHRDLLQIQRDLALDDQVSWLGFVSPGELRALYQECLAVVVPTFFEAGSFPVFEAFSVGVAVAASSVTSLPEQVGDAGLLFDPMNDESIADAIRRLWTDDALRSELGARGRARAAPFTWDRVAHEFREIYRQLASAAVGRRA